MRFLRNFIILTAVLTSGTQAWSEAGIQYHAPENVTPEMKALQTEMLNLKREIYRGEVVQRELSAEIQLILRLRTETGKDSLFHDFMLKHPDAVEAVALSALVTGAGIKIGNHLHAWHQVREAVKNNPAGVTKSLDIQKLRANAVRVDARGNRVLLFGAVMSLWTLLYDTFNTQNENLPVVYRRIEMLRNQPEMIDSMLASRIQERVQITNYISEQEDALVEMEEKFNALKKIEEEKALDANQKALREYRPNFVR